VPLVVAWRRRAVAVLAPWAVFGGILTFELLAYFRGQTASWLRYYVIAVPFVILVGATMAAARPDGARRRPKAGRLVLTGAALVMAVAGLLTSLSMIHDHELAREEAAQLEAVFDSRGATPGSRLALKRLRTEREVASYVDSLQLPRGSVLIDMALGFEIVTHSRHPTRFVVTSDRDFQESLADPVVFRLGYILVPPRERQGLLDAINRAHPSLYQDGAGIATLEKEFENVGNRPNWRLYKVNQPEP